MTWVGTLAVEGLFRLRHVWAELVLLTASALVFSLDLGYEAVDCQATDDPRQDLLVQT
jgi:hypothetical protein